VGASDHLKGKCPLMTTFLSGVMLSITPGLITGWIGWSVVGGLMNRYSYCRHPTSTPMVAAASIPAAAERLRTESPVVVNTIRAERSAIPQVIVMPVLMPSTAPLQALPQWPPHPPIVLQAPELESPQWSDEPMRNTPGWNSPAGLTS
jgi:hypothetical protein